MHILYKGFGRNIVKNKAFARKVSEVMYVHKVFGDGACDVLKIRKYGGIQVM